MRRTYILRITLCLRTPVAGVGYDGRKLTPAVAPTRNDDNREVRNTEEEV